MPKSSCGPVWTRCAGPFARRSQLRPSTRLSTMLGGELSTAARQRQTEPPRLIHLVRGDLDWIVMKCLEKDRARRYETANGLAADIHRFLANEPVVARPPSAIYRLQKAFHRNRLSFLAGGAIALALFMGAGASAWEARQARAESARAHNNLYAAQMIAAGAALEEGNLAQTRHWLDLYRTDTSKMRG